MFRKGMMVRCITGRTGDTTRQPRAGNKYRVCRGTMYAEYGSISIEDMDGKYLGWWSANRFEKWPVNNGERIKRRRAKA
jgi:hypothetical protein